MKNEQTYPHGGWREKGEVRYDFSVNINPCGLPKEIREALCDMSEAAIRYPTPTDYAALREKIVKRERAYSGAHLPTDEAHLLLGNGASELITAFFRKLRPRMVLLQEPIFYGYERAASVFASHTVYAKTTDIRQAILSEQPEMACLCQPLNPTGEVIERETLLGIAEACEECGALLLTDECFVEFLEDGQRRTLLPDLDDYPHAVILRAFTKYYAMPGVRLGYAFCGEDIARRRPGDMLPEWNVSSLAVRVGLAAADVSEDYHIRTLQLLQREKAYLRKELKKLGITVISGEANFLFIKGEEKLNTALEKKGIWIRVCDNYRGISKSGCYRIAVRTHEENAALVDAIGEIVWNGKR